MEKLCPLKESCQHLAGDPHPLSCPKTQLGQEAHLHLEPPLEPFEIPVRSFGLLLFGLRWRRFFLVIFAHDVNSYLLGLSRNPQHLSWREFSVI